MILDQVMMAQAVCPYANLFHISRSPEDIHTSHNQHPGYLVCPLHIPSPSVSPPNCPWSPFPLPWYAHPVGPTQLGAMTVEICSTYAMLQKHYDQDNAKSKFWLLYFPFWIYIRISSSYWSWDYYTLAENITTMTSQWSHVYVHEISPNEPELGWDHWGLPSKHHCEWDRECVRYNRYPGPPLLPPHYYYSFHSPPHWVYSPGYPIWHVIWASIRRWKLLVDLQPMVIHHLIMSILQDITIHDMMAWRR